MVMVMRCIVLGSTVISGAVVISMMIPWTIAVSMVTVMTSFVVVSVLVAMTLAYAVFTVFMMSGTAIVSLMMMVFTR